MLASQVNLLKEKISSFELEERRRLLRERHARECAERDYMAIEALKSAGMEYEHVETVPEYIERTRMCTLDLHYPSGWSDGRSRHSPKVRRSAKTAYIRP